MHAHIAQLHAKSRAHILVQEMHLLSDTPASVLIFEHANARRAAKLLKNARVKFFSSFCPSFAPAAGSGSRGRTPHPSVSGAGATRLSRTHPALAP